MDRLTKEELRRLVTIEEPACVSLYMPAHRTGRERREDPIRFKNLLQDAEDRLVARGLRRPEARGLLEPGIQRIAEQNTVFWQNQGDGLAMFFSPAGAWSYRLPISFEELVAVDRRFHVVPLLPLVNLDARFFVLAVSPKGVRLLECTRLSAQEVYVPQLPHGLEDVTRYVETQRELQWHTRTAPAGVAGLQAGPGKGRGSTGTAGSVRAPMYFGTGGADVRGEKNERLYEYLQWIDKAIQKALAEENAPLVFAGDPHLRGMYREVNSCRNLLDEGITGNPDAERPETLRSQAWQVIEPRIGERRRRAIGLCEEAVAKRHGSDRLDEILPAAHEGRVDTLLAARGAGRWGHFDPEKRTVEVHRAVEPEDEELINLAVARSYQAGAAVFALPQEEIPGRSALAAAFRY